MRHALAALLCLALLGGEAAAQTQVERRRPAGARGEVQVDNDFGSVTVRGWERAEVLVRGTLAAGAEGLSFDGEKAETWISVSVPEEWFHASGEAGAFRSDLEVFVPAGSQVQVSTTNASATVEGVSGTVEATTVNGSVRIVSPATAVEVETMTGSVEVRSAAREVTVGSISGAVAVVGATGSVQVETVSGAVNVRGAGLSALQVETTTGEVTIDGTMAATGEVDVESFSSPVRLALPTGLRASFDLRTFAGEIRSAVCAGTPLTRERFEPFRQLHCSTGSEELEIAVRTHDGDITITTAGSP
jgi:DUF4097 and DUF4098 domain-containing protein YvlB